MITFKVVGNQNFFTPLLPSTPTANTHKPDPPLLYPNPLVRTRWADLCGFAKILFAALFSEYFFRPLLQRSNIHHRQYGRMQKRAPVRSKHHAS